MTHITFEAEPGAAPGAPVTTIPKPVGRMLVALALVAIAAAASSRFLGVKAAQAELAPVVGARALRFVDADAGTMRVVDPVTARVVAQVSTEDATFLRAIVRAVTGGRAVDATRQGTEVLLELRQDGQFTLHHVPSGHVTSANAFGRTQVAGLFRLLVARDSVTS